MLNNSLTYPIALSAMRSGRLEVLMLADRHLSDEEVCPVGDELLGELYSASKLGLPILVPTVAPDIRAMLALFCYRRSHLHTMGLAIAATCDEEDLVRSGGRAGATLFVKSREAPQPSPAALRYISRQKITLASGLLRKMAPVDDQSDEELDEATPAPAR